MIAFIRPVKNEKQPRQKGRKKNIFIYIESYQTFQMYFMIFAAVKNVHLRRVEANWWAIKCKTTRVGNVRN